MSLVNFQQYNPGDLYLETTTGYESGLGITTPAQYVTAGVNTSAQLMGGPRGLAFRKITAGATGTSGAAAGVPSGVQTLGALFLVTIPTAMTTGLTFILHCTDDGTNAADLGLVAFMGIQTKVLAANVLCNMGVSVISTSTFVNATSGSGASLIGPEQTGSVTLSSTAGGFSTVSIQITTANLGNSAAANSVLLCRVRRIGQSTSDTLAGRLVLLGLNVATY